MEDFIKEYLKLVVGVTVSDKDNINFIFNRDVSINEEAAINMCKASVGVISDKTIVANHPWVDDADEELKQKDEENKVDLEYMRKSMIEGGSNGEE